MAEYASILLDAPMGWRRPLGLHVVEMYDTAGRLDVLERFLDGVGERRYAETIPIRTLMIAHRLEKEGDWRSLAAQIEAADRSGPRGGPVFRVDGGRTYAPMAAAHALARHCDDALPLLPPPASEPQAEVRPWARYTRGLCAGKSDVRKPYIGAQSEVDLPEVGFPPVKPVDLPDPIVCAEHAAPWKQPDLSKQPCP
jgi:hypothetical protein